MITNLLWIKGCSYKGYALIICIALLLIDGNTRLFGQGSNKYFENDSIAEGTIPELMAAKEDTAAVFFKDFFANEFTFLNTTYHGSFELKGNVNKRGMRTGIWEIYRIAGHKNKMLLARGRYLPLSLSRVIIDTVLLGYLPQSAKDSLKLQFLTEIDFNAISFPDGVWDFFSFSARVTKEYQLNAKYIMASFGRTSENDAINLQPFDFFNLFDGVQREYGDDGRMTDSSFFSKYNGGVNYSFTPSTHTILEETYYVFKHNMGLLALTQILNNGKLDEKEDVSLLQ